MQDELVGQMFSGPLQLVLVSTAGVLQLERRRPVDVLQALLQVSCCWPLPLGRVLDICESFPLASFGCAMHAGG
jgi:hypothetical protein